MTINPNKAPLIPLFHPPSSSLSPTTFSSLPDEIIVDCLARISKSYYQYICLTSKRFYALLSSPEIYEARSQIGATEPRLYVCMWLPTPTSNHRWYTLREMDNKLNLVSLRLSNSSYSPKLLDTSSVTVGSEIYQIGGTLDDTRSRDVHVFDCRTGTWRRGPSLTVGRKFARCCVLDGKIYAIGGCVNRDKAMNWGEVLDLKTQIWKPLKNPSGDDTFFEVAVIRKTLYVFFTVSGNNYAYDPKEEEGGRWRADKLGFVGMKPLSVLSRPWCVIDNIMFADIGNQYKWYDHHYKSWTMVYGLNDFYEYRCHHCPRGRTVQLVNYGGKLVIMWDKSSSSDYKRQDKKEIWCAVIRIEKRLNPLGITEIWGEFESCNSLVSSVPNSYKLLTCLSVSV